MHQPLFEEKGGLLTPKANANAICMETNADWTITLTNIRLGNLCYAIRIFCVSGVLGSGQTGPEWPIFHPPRLARIIFGISVAIIGAIDIVTSWPQVLKLFARGSTPGSLGPRPCGSPPGCRGLDRVVASLLPPIICGIVHPIPSIPSLRLPDSPASP